MMNVEICMTAYLFGGDYLFQSMLCRLVAKYLLMRKGWISVEYLDRTNAAAVRYTQDLNMVSHDPDLALRGTKYVYQIGFRHHTFTMPDMELAQTYI